MKGWAAGVPFEEPDEVSEDLFQELRQACFPSYTFFFSFPGLGQTFFIFVYVVYSVIYDSGTGCVRLVFLRIRCVVGDV